MNDDVVIIAITGGFASGKTTAAKYIEQKGFPLIYTDSLAKKIMTENEDVIENLIKEFGNIIFASKGVLNAQWLGELVFSENDEAQRKLQNLNRIVHPAVIDEMILEIEKLAKAGNNLIFVESALIFEAELEDGFDYIIVVDCQEKLQIERAKQRTNLENKQIINRINSQISLSEKAKQADFVLKNNNSIKELHKAIDGVLPILKFLKPRREEG